MTTDLTSCTWNLSRLYASPDAPELEQDLNDGPALATAFRQRHFGTLSRLTVAELSTVLIEYETLQEQLVRPQVYAQLLFAADSTNPVHQVLAQRTMEFGNALSRETLFFELELIALPDDHFAALLAAKELSSYHHFLATLRRYKPHTLPEREEQLLKQKTLTGMDAFCRLFDELAASYTFRFTFDGEERDCTGEELMALLHHPDAITRETAFSTFLNRHATDQVTYGAVFNTMALDHAQELELRTYTGGPMEPTNLGNELSATIVEQLMAVTEANYPLAQHYFRLKSKLLGLPHFKNTDIYAPVSGSDRTYSLAEARDLVLAAYGNFSPELSDIADRFFSEGRIDSPPRPGKSGGAFCMGISPHLPPYVLTNFTGTLRDVATLAHELGHGIHFVLAQEQRLVNYHPPLPLAETASVFGEMLLTAHLLASNPDRQTKISLLCATIEDIIATTCRQVMLTRFEENLHHERSNGLVTVERICDLWTKENAKLFGDAVTMIEPYRWGWSYISHFIHTRFYCYAYTFAELLVLSLYRQYQQQGAAFVPIYRQILTSGGSLSPADTVAPAGISLATTAVWEQGYAILADLIAELEATLGT